MLDTENLLKNTDFPALRRAKVDILQVNLGYLCNLSCTHCHVNAGPKRTEMASRETVESVLEFLSLNNMSVLDLTGGAPEMNPHFRYLVESATKMNIEVIDRCNLTILNEPGYEDLADFLVDQRVTISASLPCYQEQNVNEQRGKGVFESSIKALQSLNALGYGSESGLILNLVYNPNGIFLPPEQQQLEAAYKKELKQHHGIVFNELMTITNMPISRFGSMLLSKGLYDEYMSLLRGSYSANNLKSVMCRQLISVDWQGFIYDCDFNQMLDWPLLLDTSKISSHTQKDLIGSDKPRMHLRDVMDNDLTGNPIVVGEHCYGCTAGQGSSCGGALN